jgi:hypothetical protein
LVALKFKTFSAFEQRPEVSVPVREVVRRGHVG